jgi:PIN domain nuclease of toxin-antitoxin system
MRVLLDTHAFLWWVLDEPRLSEACRAVIGDVANDVMLSAVSGYEVAFKASRGRLTLPSDPMPYIEERLAATGFEPLSIGLAHAIRAGALPPIHGDPFDRMLIAQAQVEGIPLLTADPAITRYDVETIW